jgi:lysophospholipase L1-like esterase
MTVKFIPAVFLVLLFSGCAPVKRVQTAGVLPASEIIGYGRFAFHKIEGLEMISSAMHFGFTFEGTQCTLYASLSWPGAHNYIQYEMDGVYGKRLRIEGTSSKPLVITAPNDGKHIVWIYKATEAHTGPVFIQKIVAKKIDYLVKPPLRLIEFIGNSITCGAAADPSEVPCGTGAYHDQHNAYAAYGPRVARALGTDFILSSVSGIGVYRNWNSDGPTMPQVYEKADFQHTSSRQWDFSKVSPNVVSIALGTNDFSNGDGKKERLTFDSAQFVSRYIEFVKQVKSIYPQARIALLSSAMINGDRRRVLQNCLQAVKSRIDAAYPEDKGVALHFFAPMQAGGCTGHPSVAEHGLLAGELVPFFRQLIE